MKSANKPLCSEESRVLLWLLDRAPGQCAVAMNAEGIFTHFGAGAEAFFGCPAAEALGRLHYSAFHDSKEMEACRNDPAFRAALESPGWTEDDWTVIPRAGAPFRARVTLVPLHEGAGTDRIRRGWIALYRRANPVEP